MWRRGPESGIIPAPQQPVVSVSKEPFFAMSPKVLAMNIGAVIVLGAVFLGFKWIYDTFGSEAIWWLLPLIIAAHVIYRVCAGKWAGDGPEVVIEDDRPADIRRPPEYPANEHPTAAPSKDSQN